MQNWNENRDIAKNVPLFGLGRLKIGGKLERNRNIAKNVPLQQIKQDFRELLFPY